MKEQSTTELIAERDSLKQRNAEVIGKAKAEKRNLTDSEKDEVYANNSRRMEIGEELLSNNEKNLKPSRSASPARKFSFRRAISNMISGHEQEDKEAAVIEEGITNNRGRGSLVGSIMVPVESRAAFTATVESPLGVNIDEIEEEMLLPLDNYMVLSKAGARYLTNLSGDIYWPSYSGTTVAWEGETDEAADGAGTFAKGTVYKPMRLTAFVTISKQLLIQENKDIEALIRQTLASSIAQKVEATAFSKAAAATGVPNGLFQTAPTLTGTMTWGTIVDMETAVDTGNALMGNLAYIINPSLIAKAKKTVKDASGAGGFVFDGNGNGIMNGYPVYRTNNIPTNIVGTDFGAVFGNWNDYFIGQWGSIEIGVDPYTKMKSGQIDLVVNSYWNMGKIREASFKTAALS